MGESRTYAADAFEQGKTDGGEMVGVGADGIVVPPGEGAPSDGLIDGDGNVDAPSAGPGTNVTPYQGNLDAAIMHYGHAVEFQDNLNYTEPPAWSQSMRLYQGAALLEAGRPVEAEEVYRKDLEWSQQNGWTTFGLYQALEAQGKEQEAIIVKRQWESFWRNADVELTRSRL